MNRAKIILIWVIGIMFILTGISKLAHLDAMSAEMFERAQLPSLLYYAVAAFELIGGILFITAKTRQYGAFLIIIVMMGAISTHIYLHDNLAHIIVPILIIFFAGWLIVKAKKDTINCIINIVSLANL